MLAAPQGSLLVSSLLALSTGLKTGSFVNGTAVTLEMQSNIPSYSQVKAFVDGLQSDIDTNNTAIATNTTNIATNTTNIAGKLNNATNTPSTGQVLKATSGTAWSWQAESGGGGGGITEEAELSNATVGGGWTDISSDTYSANDYLLVQLTEESGGRDIVSNGTA